MPNILLTDATVRSLKAPASGSLDYWDSKFPSFACRVSQGGTKTFILKLHNSRRSIGRYPVLSLAEAREEARKLLAERTLGKVRPQSVSFERALELFLAEKKKSRRSRTVHNLTARLNRHFPFKGKLASITHQEISRRLAKITGASEHDHALAVAKTFFTWAHNRRMIDDNPTRGLAPFGHTRRARVLTDGELRRVWAATGDQSTFSAIVRLLLLTGQRRGEIAAVHASWLAKDAITIPAQVAKNGRQHTFPLCSLARAALQPYATSAGLLFPARGRPDHPFSGWSKSKAALDKSCGVTGWTLHDLRRTYRTIHARVGTPPWIAERLLNHVSSRDPLEDTYNRHDYAEEMRKAVEAYEAYILKAIISPAQAEAA